MRRLPHGSMGLVVILLLSGTAPAQTVDNPQYQQWSVWREGASVTWKTESGSKGGVQTTVTQTHTLKKLTAEKAVIEITTVTMAEGQTIKLDPVSMDIPAKAPKVDAPPPGPPPAVGKDAAPKFKQNKGKETLTINGKKLDCEWTKFEMEGGIESATWICPDVPAQLVKSVTKSPFGSSTMVLVEWKGTKK